MNRFLVIVLGAAACAVCGIGTLLTLIGAAMAGLRRAAERSPARSRVRDPVLSGTRP